MTVTYPIVPLADGEVLDPQWVSDITTAVNDTHTDVTDLELLTSAQSAFSITPSSAIGTTITAVLTLTGCVLGAGRAYSVEMIGGAYGDINDRLANFSIWKTSTSGTQIGAYYNTMVKAIAGTTQTYGKVYMRNNTAAAITLNLILALNANAGTIICDADTIRPRALVVTDVGPASAWPNASAVT